MRRITFVAVLLFAVSALAEDPDRKPWEWSDADRYAARADAERAAERVKADRAHATSKMAIQSNAVSDLARQPFDVISGKHNPHLFFEHELLDALLTLGFNDDPRVGIRVRRAYREGKESYRKQFGLPEDMWLRLEALSAAYRADRAEERLIGRASLPERERVLYPLMCRDRADTLANARREFGPAFTQFLYTAVAPDLSQIVLEKPEPRLLSLAKGECD